MRNQSVNAGERCRSLAARMAYHGPGTNLGTNVDQVIGMRPLADVLRPFYGRVRNNDPPLSPSEPHTHKADSHQQSRDFPLHRHPFFWEPTPTRPLLLGTVRHSLTSY